MAHCVLHTHKEIQDLAKELNLHPGIISSKVAIWQSANNTFDRFPTKDELTNNQEIIGEVLFYDPKDLENLLTSKAVKVVENVKSSINLEKQIERVSRISLNKAGQESIGENTVFQNKVTNELYIYHSQKSAEETFKREELLSYYEDGLNPSEFSVYTLAPVIINNEGQILENQESHPVFNIDESILFKEFKIIGEAINKKQLNVRNVDDNFAFKRLDTSDKINAVFKEFKPRSINPVEFIEAFEKLPTNRRTPKYVLELIEKYDPFVEGSKYLELTKLFKQDDFTRIHLYDNIRDVYIENGFKEEYDNLSGDQQPYMVIFGTSDIYMGRDELINDTSDFGFMMVSSMLHEIVHAHTLDSLDGNKAFSDYVNELYDKLKDLKDLKGLYGITNDKEFVAELMTNPYFEEAVLQAEPNKINQNRIKQIFKELWEAIVKLFKGNKSQFGKETLQMKKIITDLMQSNIDDFGNQYKNTVVEKNEKVSPIIPNRLNIQDDSKQSQEYWARIRKAKEAKKKKLAEKNKAQDQNKGENIKQFEKVYDEEGLSTEDSDKVDKLFKKYPQLSVAFSGNKSLYNKYLKSIFPNSNEEFKGKLFFHGTKNPIEGGKFKISEKSLAKGLWFTKQLSYAKNVEGYSTETDNPTTYGVILNISNPKHFYNSSGAILVQTPSKFKEQYNETVNDAAVFHHPESSDGKFTNNGGYNQVVVFDENQVHIIGDFADLKQAQEFIDKQSPKQAQTKRELSIQDIADNLDQYIDTANYMNQEERVTFAELIYDGYIEIKCSL